MNIYIIVKQLFYVSRGRHYQLADDNPVISVYKSFDEAQRVCDHLVRIWLQNHSNLKLHKSVPSSTIVAKYGLYDGDTCELSYNIVKEHAL